MRPLWKELNKLSGHTLLCRLSMMFMFSGLFYDVDLVNKWLTVAVLCGRY
jgi:hypothetical protein